MRRELKKLDIERVVDEYLRATTWKVRENANLAWSFSSLFMRLAGEALERYTLLKVYPPEITRAHVAGDLHLHNLYMGVIGYCAGWSVRDILLSGFGGAPPRIESAPPRHLSTALLQLANFVGTLQNEWAGAMAFNSLDTLLAPYVRADKLSYKQVKQEVQQFVYNLNINSRWGGQTPFTNVTFDLHVPADLSKERIAFAGKLLSETYANYQKEMDMINRAFLEVMLAGDATGRVFSVDSDCLCPIKNSGRTNLVKIGEYIDSIMTARSPIFIKEHNCEVLDVRDLDLKCIGLKNGKVNWQKINYLVRHPVKELLKITVTGGFNIKVTPSHSVLVLKDGKITPHAASGLKMGDYLIAPKILPSDGQTREISLAHEFVKRGKEKNIYISGVRKGDPLHKRNYGKREYRYPREVTVFPLSDIAENLEKFDLSQAKLNLAGSNIKIANNLPVTRDLVEFLGWYCAEGSAEKGGISLGFNLRKEKTIAKHLASLIKNIFGVPVYLREIRKRNLIEVRVHSKLVRRILLEIFEIGNKSQKKVPQFLFEVPSNWKKVFLIAYFNGDAWIAQNIIATSISKELIYGISTLLKQLDIFHTLDEYVWKGRTRYRVNIFNNRHINAKESRTISKIPLKESGVDKIVEKILLKQPFYYDKLGRKYRNTKQRILKIFGITKQRTTNLNNIKKMTKYARNLVIDTPPVIEEILQGNISFFRIKKIEKTNSRNGMAYDLSTESETFVADQLIVHNTFPIPTYNITRDFDWNSEIADLLFAVSAKYGIPYFQNFIKSELDPREVRAMCCRLRLEVKQLYRRHGGYFGYGDKVGSIGVVTINLPRIGYLAKTETDFFERLERQMELAKRSLEIKRKLIKHNIDRGLLPFTRRYLGTLLWHFSTIGLIGANEACLNFLGKSIADPDGKAFALKVLKFMRDRVLQFQRETGNAYNLEATPAEGLSYRFARLDKRKWPRIITAGKKVPYYTNSTHLPVNYTDDLFAALKHQEDLQTLYTGGCVEKTAEVITNRGVMQIGDIVKNFKKLKDLHVITYNEKKAKTEWKPVEKAVYVDVKKANKIKIKFEKNIEVVTSDWHPFLVLEKIKIKTECPICKKKVKNVKSFAVHLKCRPRCREIYRRRSKYGIIEKRADELNINDKVLQVTNPVKNGKAGNKELAWITGFYLADGACSAWIDNRGGNKLRRYRVTLNDETRETIEEAKRILNKIFGCAILVIQKDKRGKNLILATTKKNVAAYFRQFGEGGKKRYTVRLTPKLKQFDFQTSLALLAGIIDGDGYIDKQHDCEISTVSRAFAKDIEELLYQLGILPRLTEKKSVRKNEVPLYRICIPKNELLKVRDYLIKYIRNPQKLRLLKNLPKQRKRFAPVVRVKSISKVVTDDIFCDLMVKDNHNYLAGKGGFVFVHNTIFHAFIGEKISPDAAKLLVRKIVRNFRLPYFTLTPTFAICADHGYFAGEIRRCPSCRKPTELYSRVVGYLRPVSSWNTGKQEEFRQRREYKIGSI